MTVTTSTNRADFVGNGTADTFPFTFRIFDETDLEVREGPSGATAVKILNTDYTVTINFDGTGDVVFVVPPVNLNQIVVRRVLPLTQLIDFPVAGKFPAPANEEAEDRSVMIHQQKAEEDGRRITLPVDSLLTNVTLPSPGNGLFFRWNSAGTALELIAVQQGDVQNVITVRGDIIRGGVSAIPERLPKAVLGSILKAGSLDIDYLLPGNEGEILVIQGGDLIYSTPTAAGVGVETGTVAPFVGTAAPSGYLLCDGAEVSASTFEDLFTVMVGQIADWGLGTKVGDFTTDFATDDKLDLVAHGLTNGTVVHVASTVTLPGGLSPNTKYFVVNADTDDFELSLTSGGATVDITDDGTGTHSVYNNFQTPDLRGRLPLGKDDMGGVPAGRVTATEADNLGQGAGSEVHQLTVAELASHLHSTPLIAIACTQSGGCPGPGGTFSAGPFGSTNSTSVGGDTPHPNVQPYQTLNYIVKT